MEVNQNLKNWYYAQCKLNDYNEYSNRVKNGQFVNEELFASADYNHDGVVNKDDYNATVNLIKSMDKDNLTYDFNQDGRFDIKDLLIFDVNTDIDGDGQVSESERNWLISQKENIVNDMKKVRDKVAFDLNNDGKISIEDLAEFMAISEELGLNYRNSDDKFDKYLTYLHDKFNKKVANLGGGSGISGSDLAYIDQRLEIAERIVNGDASTVQK